MDVTIPHLPGTPGAEMPLSARAVAVCIPVRNEEALLPASLAALAALEVDAELTLTFCFALDACRDRSAELIAKFANRSVHAVRVEAVPNTGAPNAGRARQAALAIGVNALSGLHGAMLLTTDADTRPARDWIRANYHALAMADVATGRIIREDAGDNEMQDRIEHYLDRLYSLRRHYDPVTWEGPKTHHHVGGASLAFRLEAYLALGGFRPIESAEDALIVDDAHRLGLRVRRDRDVVVVTSSRRCGRARNGLADHLRALANDTAPILVDHPEQVIWQYRGHALARASFERLQRPDIIPTLADALGVEPGHITRVAASAPNAEAFATHVVPAAPQTHGLVSLDDAERAVELLEQRRYDRAA